MLAATLAVGWFVLSPLEHPVLARTATAAAVYAANIWFMRNEESYFAAARETHPLRHMWSLGVAEQFYAVGPFVLLLAIRRGASRRRARVIFGAITLVSHRRGRRRAVRSCGMCSDGSA